MIQTKDWLMLAAIFGAMLVSLLWPQAGAPFRPYPMVFMMVLLFLSFLSIPIESILQTARGRGLRFCGWLVLKLVVLPIGLYYATRVVYPEYALSALLLGGISSGVVSPFFSTLLNANTALVIMMVTASSVLVPFTLPVLVRALAGQTLVISLPAMVWLLAQVIFAPLVAAELLRFLSSRTAERISRNHYVPKFIESLKTKGRSPATVLAYRSDLEQLVDYLLKRQRVLPEQVRPDDLDSFRDTLLADKYTPKSVSRKLNAVKTFFRWMISENIITSDVSASVAHPKIENTLPKFLSQLEYRALRDVVRSDTRIAAIIELILQTGLRISEVASLKTANVGEGSMKIEAYATQPERNVPINKPATDVLASYMAIRPKADSPYVFISKNGKALAVRNIRASIARYVQRAELPNYSVNDLRTTFIVENLKAGVDIVLLSQVTGHKRLSTTERYLELAQITEPGKKQTLIEL